MVVATRRHTSIVLLSVLVFTVLLHTIDAQSDMMDEEFDRDARAPKPKFIRFGRGGAKLIRFGKRSDPAQVQDDYELNDELMAAIKRAGPKVIRFG